MNQRFEVSVQIEAGGLPGTLWVIIEGSGKSLTTTEAAKVAVLRARRRGYLPTGLTGSVREYHGVRDAGYYAERAPD
jgi:hypothetical protein